MQAVVTHSKRAVEPIALHRLRSVLPLEQLGQFPRKIVTRLLRIAYFHRSSFGSLHRISMSVLGAVKPLSGTVIQHLRTKRLTYHVRCLNRWYLLSGSLHFLFSRPASLCSALPTSISSESFAISPAITMPLPSQLLFSVGVHSTKLR